MSWQAPIQTGGATITAYDLRHIRSDASSKADGNWTLVSRVWTGAGALSHTLNSLTGGVRYDVQVRAVNSAGDGPWSTTRTGTPTAAANAPGAPRNLIATGNGPTRIDLSWSTPLNDGGAAVTGYRIEFSTDRIAWSGLLSNSGSTISAYSHSGLTAGSTRYYRVSAMNSAGTGPPSNIAEANSEAALAPDLAVDRPTVSASAPSAGERFTLNATVRNQGNGSSGFTTLRYYQSTGSAITTSDNELGTDSVSRLDASESGDESVSLTAPSTPGTYYYGACVDAVTDESDTTNNCSSAVTVTLGAAPAPDLVVGDPNLGGSVPASGTSFILNAAVDNEGSAPSPRTTLRYYRSTDSTISSSDTLLDTVTVIPLGAPGGYVTNIRPIAPSAPGTYYYGACVDAVTDESDTTNNCSSAVTVTVGAAPAPDLVVDTPTASESAPAAGARFTLNAKVRNQGNGDAGFTRLRYYQSTDASITTSDTEVDTDSVSPLDASESGDEFVRLDAPSTPGTYHYGACVEAVLGESDTTNNCSSAVTVTVGAAPAPDLVVGTPTVSNSTSEPGVRFALNATVRNQGNSRSGFTTLRYYQSTDSTITTADTAAGTDSVFRLDAAASGDESISLTAPSTPGTYYYGACVDSVTDESDTTNNCSTGVTITVGAAPAPDLVVGTPTVSESAPTAGAAFTLSATVRNQGNGRSGFTTLRYYQSTDSTITTADTAAGTDSVSGLNAAESGDDSITLTAPSTPGTYYYGACVDAVSDETDTANNCSTGVTITVGAAPAPDLVVGTPTVSNSTSEPGVRFALNATVRNQGNSRSGFTTLRYYQSTDSTITTADTAAGTDSVFRLDAAASGDESISLTVPSTPGTYYYGACVDSVTDESDTTNNCSTGVTITVGAAPAPDLVVGTPTVSESAPTAGAAFTLSATVRNQGNGRSGFTTLRYYQSTDSTITTADTAAGTDSVSGLNAAESGDDSITLTAPSTPGAYYYGACVDSVSDESDTTNNCSPAIAVTVGAGTTLNPDLVVDMGGGISNPFAGSSFRLSVAVRNQGTAPSTSTTLRYYRSTDTTISSSDTEVGTDSVPGINGGNAFSRHSINLTAPSTPDIYYYGACVDALSGESDTTNNCSTALRVTVRATSDLVITDLGVSNSSPAAGAYFTLNVTVLNQGIDSSDSALLRFYRSADATIMTTDTSDGIGFISSLDPSESGENSITLTAPDSPGTYYYGACVEGVDNEINTGNNCSAAVRVTVVDAPDLILTGLDCIKCRNQYDRRILVGTSIHLTAYLGNRGSVESNPTMLRYYLSTDSTITTADTLVSTKSVGAIGPKQQTFVSSSVWTRRPLRGPTTMGHAWIRYRVSPTRLTTARPLAPLLRRWSLALILILPTGEP